MKKKRNIFKILSLLTGLSVLFSVGCGGGGNGHAHVFDQQVQDEIYLKNEKSCTEAKQYYYSCACGEKGEETFSVGMKGVHSYTAEVAGEDYVKTEATCQTQAVYYKSCIYCGRPSGSNSLTFSAGELGDHNYSQKVVSETHLASEATYDAAATYYKSCICGLNGTETFTDGKPLRDLTDEEKEGYKPVSITMSLYDPANSVYGFTYNTEQKPLRPVIQVAEGNALTESAQEFAVTYSKWSSYDENDNSISYYVSKAEVTLDPSTTYTYRVYDKTAQIGSEAVTFTTKDTTSTSFSFSHVSDSQAVDSTGLSLGTNFGQVLSNINTDFILHTGDVVENSKYEYEWKQMLDDNFAYLSKTPIMALAGNHDTTYKAGFNETWKHFNNKIPTQASTGTGYYYSFTYGNAKFIMLNTNNNSSGALDTEQYDWLISELEDNDSVWTIVAMHAPLYSVGQWGSDPDKNQQSIALRDQLQGVFADYGVDLVLQGHDHMLSRTYPIDKNGDPTTETWDKKDGVDYYSVDPSGVIYAMDGTAGTNTKSLISGVDYTVHYKYAKSCPVRTWADITIDGNTLTFTVKNTNGTSVNILQDWGIKKSA